MSEFLFKSVFVHKKYSQTMDDSSHRCEIRVGFDCTSLTTRKIILSETMTDSVLVKEKLNLPTIIDEKKHGPSN